MNSNLWNYKWEYRIDGKINGMARIVICLVLSAFLVVLTIDQLQPQPNKYLPVALGFGSMAAVFLCLTAVLAIRYFCFRVLIGSTGFYVQTTPFNGTYYEYSDIKSCREELKIARHRHRPGGSSQYFYFYFFIFTTANGKTKKFQFEKSVCEHEINVLKQHIGNRRPA